MPPFLPLICYEAIFPGALRAPEGRAEWLVQVTNDAWFGTASGPYQHFAQARVRAIEQGLPLARAANTGISAMIDPLGRVVAEHRARRNGLRRRASAGTAAAYSLCAYWRFVGFDCDVRVFRINCFILSRWYFATIDPITLLK